MRQKIGVVYGNPETTTGGNALKFYASVRLDIRKIGAVRKKRRAGGGQQAPREGGEEQGRAAVPQACQYLGEHPELAEELRGKLVALRKAENARLVAPVPVAGGESEAA